MRTRIYTPFSLLCLLAILKPDVGSTKRINSYAGPFIAYGIRFWECGSDNTMHYSIRVSHFNPSRPRELQTLTGNMSLRADFNDEWWLHAVMDIRSNNQWKENAFIFSFPIGACTAMRTNGPDFYRVVFKKDPKSKQPCVIQPGLYTFEKEPVAWVFPNIPVMPYGHYRLRVSTGRPKSKSAAECVAVELKIIPKI